MKTLKTIGFWVISCTWGIIMTLIGAITALILLICGYKPKRHGPCIYFEVGESWGGVELGAFFLVNKNPLESTKHHEMGHGFQNLIFGPLMPFIVCLPSALRYHVRNYRDPNHKIYLLTSVLFVVMVIVAIPLIILANIYLQIWPLIIAGAWVLYTFVLFIWQLLEIRNYCKNQKESPYDSCWFEGMASGWGTNLYQRF